MLYLLVAGNVKIVVSGNRIAQIGAGEICGEMAFLEESVASATAEAEHEVNAYAIDWDVLSDLFWSVSAPWVTLLPLTSPEFIKKAPRPNCCEAERVTSLLARVISRAGRLG